MFHIPFVQSIPSSPQKRQKRRRGRTIIHMQTRVALNRFPWQGKVNLSPGYQSKNGELSPLDSVCDIFV